MSPPPPEFLPPAHAPSLSLLDVPTVEHIDLSQLPAGRVSRRWLVLTEDGLGYPVRIPVLIARGRKPGPCFGLTAALHGDELNGIPLIHHLFDRLDLQRLKGTLLAVPVTNVPGFLRKIRYLPNGTDPNHVFPGQIGSNLANAYIGRLTERLVPHFDFLVDLHTARRGNANSLYIRADLSQPLADRMARLFAPQIILNNPANDHTLRGSVAARGVPAITVEIGDPARFQFNYIKRSYAGLRAVLSEFGLLPARRKPVELPEPVICSRSRWLFTDAGGLLNVLPPVTHVVRPGEVIAQLSNVFGDRVREYTAPEAGIVIGRSMEPYADTGARILHLGEISPQSPALQVGSPEQPVPGKIL